MWRKSDAQPVPTREEPAPVIRTEPVSREPGPAQRASDATHLGKTIAIKGEITGREDLYLDGEVDGTIHLADARLTVGPAGRLRADAEAQEIEVHGDVRGTLLGRERVRIGRTGKVAGDVVTRRIAVEDGAVIRGSVDIVRPGEARTPKPVVAIASPAASVAIEGTGAVHEPIH